MDKRYKISQKFMFGAAIAYNLKKWLNYKEIKFEIAAQSDVGYAYSTRLLDR